MRFSKVKWFLGVLGVCLLYWLVDSVWSYYSFEINLRALIFSEPRTLTDTVLLKTPPYQVVSRLVLTLLIITGGWFLYKYVSTIKSSEQRAHASEERFRSFSDQSLVGIYLVKDSILTYVNPKFADIFGYSVEECLDNMHFSRLTHPEELTKVAEQLRRRVDGEAHSLHYEARGVRKDGQAINLEIYGSIFMDRGVRSAMGAILDITDRKVAERALRVSEKRLLKAQAVAQVGSWEMDPNKRVFWASEEAHRIYGFEMTENLELSVSQVQSAVASEYRAEMDKAMLDLLSGEGEYDQTFAILRNNDSAKRWIHSIAELEYDQEGRPAKVVGVIQDITDFKEKERDLRTSEERSRQILHTATDGFCRIDSEGRLLEVNRAYCQMTGYAEHELLAMRVNDLDALDSPKEVAARIQVLAEKGSALFDSRQRRKDGSMFDVEVSVQYMQGQNGGEIVSFVRDVTDRKLAERALKESEERNRQILHTAMDGFWRVDAHSRLVEVNEAYCRMSGYSQDELLGMTVGELEALESPENIADRFKEILEIGYDRFTSRHRRKDGSLFDIEVSIQYRQGEDDGEFAVFLRDITERIRAEEENARLEASLRQAQKLQAVGTLAGGVAHEFNNLLAAIMGYSERIVDASGGRQDLAANAAQILKASERGRDLVLNILSFTRSVESQTRPMDLNVEISNSKDMLRQLIPRTVSISTKLAPDLAQVGMDASHLNQILMNLVTNACHAMPDGGEMVIKTENISVDEMVCPICGEKFSGDYALLSVSDTGQGMDADTVQRIFEPFFSTKEIGSGTGLGLSVVQGLVKSHNGHIACNSEVGAGATFDILLPILKSGEAAPVTKPLAPSMVTGGTESILLVDDEESLRNIVQQYLNEMGYRIHQAGNGEDALEIYRKHPGEIDLVVLDLGMAGMGGHKCLQEILAINPGAKVIVASGYTTDDQDRKVLSTGAAAFVGKPFKMSELLEIVRNVLDKS